MKEFNFECPELTESDKEYAERLGLTKEKVHEYRLQLAVEYARKGTIDRGMDPYDLGLPKIYIDKLVEQGFVIVQNKTENEYDINKINEAINLQFSDKYKETYERKEINNEYIKGLIIERVLLAPELANALNLSYFNEKYLARENSELTSYLEKRTNEDGSIIISLDRYNKSGKNRGSSYPKVAIDTISNGFEELSKSNTRK